MSPEFTLQLVPDYAFHKQQALKLEFYNENLSGDDELVGSVETSVA